MSARWVRLRSVAFAGFVLLALSAPAGAVGLTGLSVDGGYYIPDASTVYVDATWDNPTFVVGAGQEASVDIEGVTDLLIDFGESDLTITLQTVLSNPTWLSQPFNGLIFDTAGPGFGITGFTVDGSTTMAGFDASRVTVTANQIRINWGGLSYVDGTQVKIDFSVAAIPEPGTAALLACGLLGLGLRRRALRS